MPFRCPAINDASGSAAEIESDNLGQCQAVTALLWDRWQLCSGLRTAESENERIGSLDNI